MDVFDKINEVFGSQTALAKKLGVVPMTVTQWKARGRIPAERCVQVANASEGRITLCELRPDIFATPGQPEESPP